MTRHCSSRSILAACLLALPLAACGGDGANSGGTGGTAGHAGNGGSAEPQLGSIIRQVWSPVSGTTVAQVPVTTTPTSTFTLTSFEAPSDIGDNYGQRILGFLVPPLTGEYTFWIAADEAAELSLSTDATPGNKTKIAWLTAPTLAREWNKLLTDPNKQKSAPITLTAGNRYYIEAVMKEGTGKDHLAVAWSKPGDAATAEPVVIPGTALMPYVPGGGAGGAGGGAGGAGGKGGAGGAGGKGGAGGNGGAGSGGANNGNPFLGATLYAEPTIAACGQSSVAAKEICATPQGEWIGDWSGDPAGAVMGAIAAGGSSLRVLVAYNIYNRDCGGHSGGGAQSPSAYRSWIDGFANGIGNSKVVVILEPDALANSNKSGCGSATAGDSTAELIKYAVEKLSSKPNAYVYIDAGNPNWHPADTTANLLNQVSVSKAAGFALNVSNYCTTDSVTTYGKNIANIVKKPFVIDTSRNGKGPGSDWCNPPGRGLGKKPSAATGDSMVHAWLWIKRPGESDGTCNGGPAAGSWFDSYATELYNNRAY